MKTVHITQVLTALLLSISCSSCSSNDGLAKDLIEQPTKEEEEIIAGAIDAFDRGLYSRSREEWTSLRDGYPASYFIPLAQLKIADCYFATGDFPEAVSTYQEFLRLYPAHEAAGYAQSRLAESLLRQYRGIKNDQQPLKDALQAYELVLSEYPSSDFAQSAQLRIADIKKLMAEYEVSVAEFYEKQGQGKAAEQRRKSANK